MASSPQILFHFYGDCKYVVNPNKNVHPFAFSMKFHGICCFHDFLVNAFFEDINPCFHIKKVNFCQVDSLLDSVKWDNKGLAVAIAQNVDTGAILMQGFANREAVVTTISSRKATFYSRSRSTLWTKGETSNNFINVHDVFLDCDHDSVSSCCLFPLNYLHFLLLFFGILLNVDYIVSPLGNNLDNIPWEA